MVATQSQGAEAPAAESGSALRLLAFVRPEPFGISALNADERSIADQKPHFQQATSVGRMTTPSAAPRLCHSCPVGTGAFHSAIRPSQLRHGEGVHEP
jgi:hypothetical protein